MKVNFFASLRPIAGQKTVDFDIYEGITAQQLLETVVLRFPEMREVLVNENGQLYRHVHLFVNGRDAPFLENAMDYRIKPGDKIDIFPAVGGG